MSRSIAFLRKSQIIIETAGNNQNAGGVVLLTGKDNTEAFAAVLTVTGMLMEDPAVTVTGEAGPLQAALDGAPVQATVTLNGPPVAASCSANEADCPALMVAALPPGGTVSERLPPAEFTVTAAVLVALAPLLSVTVAVTVYVPAML